MSKPEFTGERYIPGQGGAQIAYEHLHRYLFASRLAMRRLVLDVATGSGYGAALLARSARRVWAMDIDREALEFARGAWKRENLDFFQADATRLPLPSGSVDLAVAVEVLEHLEDPEELVRELARVCAPAGVAVISTPNKSVYSDARAYRNPYHVHEFGRDDLLMLLKGHFRNVRLLDQHTRAGSLITGSTSGADPEEILTDPAPAGCGPAVEPMYHVALCGRGDLPEQVPAASAYLDLTDMLLREWEQRQLDSATEIGRLNDEITKLGVWGKELEETVARRDEALRKALGRLEALQERHDDYVRKQQEEYERLRREFDDRGLWAKDLEKRVADRDALLGQTGAELERVGENLARIRHHLLYRILCRLGMLPR